MTTVMTAQMGVNALNFLIAKHEGIAVVWQHSCFTVFTKDPDEEQVVYSPATDHGQAGPLNHAHGISLVCVPRAVNGHDWKAFAKDLGKEFFSHDPLLASMRAYVHLYYGDSVEIPSTICV